MKKKKGRVGRPPIDPNTRKVMVSISLPSEQLNLVDKLANRFHMSRSEVIRDILEEYIECNVSGENGG